MLEENVIKALDQLEGEFDIVKVTDICDIIAFGVMATPAFAINDEVQFVGLSPVSKIVSTVENRHSS